jgi:hypothetical protein
MIPGFHAVRPDWPTEKRPVSFIFIDTQSKCPESAECHTACLCGDKDHGV